MNRQDDPMRYSDNPPPTDTTDTLRAEVESLKRELAEAKRDAERYRYLRVRIPVSWINQPPDDYGGETYNVEVDAAIDRAIAKDRHER